MRFFCDAAALILIWLVFPVGLGRRQSCGYESVLIVLPCAFTSSTLNLYLVRQTRPTLPSSSGQYAILYIVLRLRSGHFLCPSNSTRKTSLDNIPE